MAALSGYIGTQQNTYPNLPGLPDAPATDNELGIEDLS